MKPSAILRAMYAHTRLSAALLGFVDALGGKPSVGEFYPFPESYVFPPSVDLALPFALAQPFRRIGLFTDTLPIGADGSGNTWLVAIEGKRNTVYLQDHDSSALYAVADGLETFERFMTLVERGESPTAREQAALSGHVRFVPELGIELPCRPPTGGPRVLASLRRQLKAAGDLLAFVLDLEYPDIRKQVSEPRSPRRPPPAASSGVIVAEMLRAFLHDEPEVLRGYVEQLDRKSAPWLRAAGQLLLKKHADSIIARGYELVPQPPKRRSNEEIVADRAAATLAAPDEADVFDLKLLLNGWLTTRLDDATAVNRAAVAVKKIVERNPELIGPVLDFGFRVGRDGHRQVAIEVYAAVLATPMPEPHTSGRAFWLRVLNNAINATHAIGNLEASKHLCDFAAPFAAENPYIFHGSACTYVAVGELDKAAEQLTLAVQHRYEHLGKMCTDSHLAPLRGRPEFSALITAFEAK